MNKKHHKSKLKEAEEGFPDPSYLKEIPFPNEKRYKELSDKYFDLLKDHVETRVLSNPAEEVNPKVADYLNTGLYGLRASKQG